MNKKNIPQHIPFIVGSIATNELGQQTIVLKGGKLARVAKIDPAFPPLPQNIPCVEVDDLNEIDFTVYHEFYLYVSQKNAAQATSPEFDIPNRYKKLAHLKNLEVEMRNKPTWLPAINNPISFTNDGKRQNGDNRLTALQRLDFPVPIRFVTGYPRWTNAYADAEQDPRSQADRLEIDEVPHGRILVPMFNQVKRLMNAQKNNSANDRHTLVRLLAENEPILRRMGELYKLKGAGILRKSYVGAVIFLAMASDPDNVSNFAEALTGQKKSINKDDPSYQFLQFLQKAGKVSRSEQEGDADRKKRSGDPILPTEIMKKGLAAVRAYLEGRDLTKLMAMDDYSYFTKHFPPGSQIREWAMRAKERAALAEAKPNNLSN